jgi:hypothetical protein
MTTTIPSTPKETGFRANGPMFSDAEEKDAVRLLNDEFGASLLAGEHFIIEGEIDDESLLLTCQLARRELDQVTRLEVGFNLPEDDAVTVLDARGLMVEFLGALLTEWFSGSRMPPPPLEWVAYPYANFTMYHRGSVRNEDLIAQADKLLMEAGFDTDLD